MVKLFNIIFLSVYLLSDDIVLYFKIVISCLKDVRYVIGYRSVIFRRVKIGDIDLKLVGFIL